MTRTLYKETCQNCNEECYPLFLEATCNKCALGYFFHCTECDGNYHMDDCHKITKDATHEISEGICDLCNFESTR